MSPIIDDLLRQRRLERVMEDSDAAQMMVEEAKRHLESTERRNPSEYDIRFFDIRELRADLEHARAIVAAVERQVRR